MRGGALAVVREAELVPVESPAHQHCYLEQKKYHRWVRLPAEVLRRTVRRQLRGRERLTNATLWNWRCYHN